MDLRADMLLDVCSRHKFNVFTSWFHEQISMTMFEPFQYAGTGQISIDDYDYDNHWTRDWMNKLRSAEPKRARSSKCLWKYWQILYEFTLTLTRSIYIPMAGHCMWNHNLVNWRKKEIREEEICCSYPMKCTRLNDENTFNRISTGVSIGYLNMLRTPIDFMVMNTSITCWYAAKCSSAGAR